MYYFINKIGKLIEPKPGPDYATALNHARSSRVVLTRCAPGGRAVVEFTPFLWLLMLIPGSFMEERKISHGAPMDDNLEAAAHACCGWAHACCGVGGHAWGT